MLKTYRIISFVFILFLFGFTPIAVSPVFADDSKEFVACTQIKDLKGKKNCFKNLARRLDESLYKAYAKVIELRTKADKQIKEHQAALTIEMRCLRCVAKEGNHPFSHGDARKNLVDGLIMRVGECIAPK